MFSEIHKVLREKTGLSSEQCRLLAAEITVAVANAGYLKVDLKKLEDLFESIKLLEKQFAQVYPESKKSKE